MDINFKIEVKRTLRRKTILLEVVEQSLKVRVPMYYSNKDINYLIEKKLSWIKKKIHTNKSLPKIHKKEFKKNEIFLYKGSKYRLNFHAKKSSLVYLDGKLIFVNKFNKSSKTKILLESFFRTKSQELLNERTLFFSKTIGVRPSKVIVRFYRRRWGSCSYKGNISYNWMLIFAPISVIDYVVIHELCHLIEHNHSKRFWMEVKKYCPEFKVHKDWLRSNSNSLTWG